MIMGGVVSIDFGDSLILDSAYNNNCTFHLQDYFTEDARSLGFRQKCYQDGLCMVVKYPQNYLTKLPKQSIWLIPTSEV